MGATIEFGKKGLMSSVRFSICLINRRRWSHNNGGRIHLSRDSNHVTRIYDQRVSKEIIGYDSLGNSFRNFPLRRSVVNKPDKCAFYRTASANLASPHIIKGPIITTAATLFAKNCPIVFCVKLNESH